VTAGTDDMKRNGVLTMQKTLFIQLVIGLLIGGGLGALLGYFGKCTTGACPLTANPWRGGFIGAMIGGLFAFSAGGPRAAVPEPAPAGHAGVANAATESGQPGAPRHITTAEEFDSVVLKADKPVLVDFYADWCGPCRMLAPTIENLAKQYEGRVVVAKVNVDHVGQVASRYGIQGIPAVVVFDKGKEVQRLVGLRPAGDYAKVLDKLVEQPS
jgi:thioredoxin 1